MENIVAIGGDADTRARACASRVAAVERVLDVVRGVAADPVAGAGAIHVESGVIAHQRPGGTGVQEFVARRQVGCDVQVGDVALGHAHHQTETHDLAHGHVLRIRCRIPRRRRVRQTAHAAELVDAVHVHLGAIMAHIVVQQTARAFPVTAVALVRVAHAIRVAGTVDAAPVHIGIALVEGGDARHPWVGRAAHRDDNVFTGGEIQVRSVADPQLKAVPLEPVRHVTQCRVHHGQAAVIQIHIARIGIGELQVKGVHAANGVGNGRAIPHLVTRIDPGLRVVVVAVQIGIHCLGDRQFRLDDGDSRLAGTGDHGVGVGAAVVINQPGGHVARGAILVVDSVGHDRADADDEAVVAGAVVVRGGDVAEAEARILAHATAQARDTAYGDGAARESRRDDLVAQTAVVAGVQHHARRHQRIHLQVVRRAFGQCHHDVVDHRLADDHVGARGVRGAGVVGRNAAILEHDADRGRLRGRRGVIGDHIGAGQEIVAGGHTAVAVGVVRHGHGGSRVQAGRDGAHGHRVVGDDQHVGAVAGRRISRAAGSQRGVACHIDQGDDSARDGVVRAGHQQRAVAQPHLEVGIGDIRHHVASGIGEVEAGRRGDGAGADVVRAIAAGVDDADTETHAVARVDARDVAVDAADVGQRRA